MKFKLMVDDLLIKKVSEDYIFLFSLTTRHQLLLGKSLEFLTDGNWYCTTNFPLSISKKEQASIEKAIKQNSDFFLIDFENQSENHDDNTPNTYTIDRYTDKLCSIFSINPKPWWIMIETITNCNLKCKHCYNCNNNKMISPLAIEKLMSLLKPDDNFSVTLTGGEVLLHPQLIEMLMILKKYKKAVSFNTNGTLLSEKKLLEIVNSGCVIDTFQISLYATTADIHDRITGVKGSFEKTISAINLLKKYGIRTRIASLVMPQNVNQVKSLISFSRKNGLQINFCFKCISNCHDACINSECDLSVEQFSAAYTDYLYSINTFYLNPQAFYNNHICMAGISKCTMGADGELFLCPTWKEYPFVNINDISTFDEFWHGSQISKIRDITRNDFSECSSCEIRDYCRPCLADNFNKNRDIMLVNPDHCKLEKIRHTLELERTEQNNSRKTGE